MLHLSFYQLLYLIDDLPSQGSYTLSFNFHGHFSHDLPFPELGAMFINAYDEPSSPFAFSDRRYILPRYLQ